MKNPFKRKLSEHAEQVLYYQWCLGQGLPIFAIPNGGHRFKSVAKKLKDEGVRSGVPDMFLPIAMAGYYGMFVEMKAEDGTLSDNQEVWCKDLNARGYCVIVPLGHKAAIETTQEYLNRKPTVAFQYSTGEDEI